MRMNTVEIRNLSFMVVLVIFAILWMFGVL